VALPLYAVALDLPPAYFTPAFEDAMFRLRMTHYPPMEQYESQQYGIAPHVDTSFFTTLACTTAGLVVHSQKAEAAGKSGGGWVMVKERDGCLIVNTGQLLRQITNDSWVAVKHMALNTASDQPRYSLPFFFNANPTVKMPVVHTCVSQETPAKYPPTSYLEGQGVAQGE
jgi:isopenicillin N synthase-like dioxygenase